MARQGDAPPWQSITTDRPLHPCRARHYARRAQITRLVYPQMFHATFATRLGLAQVNLTVIQEMIGHANIKPPARYVSVAGKVMLAAIEKLEGR